MHEHNSLTLPFGKYKGACAACVLDHDHGYAEWCLAQDWLPERHPELFAAWRSAGVRPLAKCAATTGTGDPCSLWAKDGPLCTRHYRQAERILAATMAGMEWDFQPDRPRR